MTKVSKLSYPAERKLTTASQDSSRRHEETRHCQIQGVISTNIKSVDQFTETEDHPSNQTKSTDQEEFRRAGFYFSRSVAVAISTYYCHTPQTSTAWLSPTTRIGTEISQQRQRLTPPPAPKLTKGPVPVYSIKPRQGTITERIGLLIRQSTTTTNETDQHRN